MRAVLCLAVVAAESAGDFQPLLAGRRELPIGFRAGAARLRRKGLAGLCPHLLSRVSATWLRPHGRGSEKEWDGTLLNGDSDAGLSRHTIHGDLHGNGGTSCNADRHLYVDLSEA